MGVLCTWVKLLTDLQIAGCELHKMATRLGRYSAPSDPLKGLRRMLRVSWTAKKTNEWVLNKAGVKRELLDLSKLGS